MILIVMMKPQRIMLSNNLLEVGKYSNMEDELCGYQERMIGQESKTPPKFGSFIKNPYICSQELEYYDYGNIGTR